MSGNGLEAIPEELFKLKYLRRLNMSFNLVSEWDDVPMHLEGLSLSNNKISDITGYLTQMQRLIFLDLSNNCLTMITPLDRVPTLQFLYLRNNRISECRELANLKDLQEVDLQGNLISAWEDVKYLEYCSELVILNLQANPVVNLLESSGYGLNLDKQYLSNSSSSARGSFSTRKLQGSTISIGNSFYYYLSNLPIMVKIGLFCRSSETYENSIWYLAFEETATDLYTVFNQEFDCHKGHMVEYLDGEAALRHSSAPKEGGIKSRAGSQPVRRNRNQTNTLDRSESQNKLDVSKNQLSRSNLDIQDQVTSRVRVLQTTTTTYEEVANTETKQEAPTQWNGTFAAGRTSRSPQTSKENITSSAFGGQAGSAASPGNYSSPNTNDNYNHLAMTSRSAAYNLSKRDEANKRPVTDRNQSTSQVDSSFNPQFSFRANNKELKKIDADAIKRTKEDHEFITQIKEEVESQRTEKLMKDFERKSKASMQSLFQDTDQPSNIPPPTKITKKQNIESQDNGMQSDFNKASQKTLTQNNFLHTTQQFKMNQNSPQKIIEIPIPNENPHLRNETVNLDESTCSPPNYPPKITKTLTFASEDNLTSNQNRNHQNAKNTNQTSLSINSSTNMYHKSASNLIQESSPVLYSKISNLNKVQPQQPSPMKIPQLTTGQISTPNANTPSPLNPVLTTSVDPTRSKLFQTKLTNQGVSSTSNVTTVPTARLFTNSAQQFISSINAVNSSTHQIQDSSTATPIPPSNLSKSPPTNPLSSTHTHTFGLPTPNVLSSNNIINRESNESIFTHAQNIDQYKHAGSENKNKAVVITGAGGEDYAGFEASSANKNSKGITPTSDYQPSRNDHNNTSYYNFDMTNLTRQVTTTDNDCSLSPSIVFLPATRNASLSIDGKRQNTLIVAKMPGVRDVVMEKGDGKTSSTECIMWRKWEKLARIYETHSGDNRFAEAKLIDVDQLLDAVSKLLAKANGDVSQHKTNEDKLFKEKANLEARIEKLEDAICRKICYAESSNANNSHMLLTDAKKGETLDFASTLNKKASICNDDFRQSHRSFVELEEYNTRDVLNSDMQESINVNQLSNLKTKFNQLNQLNHEVIEPNHSDRYNSRDILDKKSRIFSYRPDQNLIFNKLNIDRKLEFRRHGQSDQYKNSKSQLSNGSNSKTFHKPLNRNNASGTFSQSSNVQMLRQKSTGNYGTIIGGEILGAATHFIYERTAEGVRFRENPEGKSQGGDNASRGASCHSNHKTETANEDSKFTPIDAFLRESRQARSFISPLSTIQNNENLIKGTTPGKSASKLNSKTAAYMNILQERSATKTESSLRQSGKPVSYS